MKTILSKILVFSLAVTLCITMFTGCKKKTEEKKPANTMKADIVVIGGGGAGMTAALQASQNGAKNVVVLEKMPQTGGNTVYATAGLNAANTEQQRAKGIKDSVGLMVEDTMKGGKGINDKELVKTLAENSADAVKWIEQIGGDLSDVGRGGGASVDRVHRPAGGAAIGPMLVKILNENLAKASIPVKLNTAVSEIMLDKDGKISGVKAKDKNGKFVINCKAVILAAGGFGANSDMVVKYNPKLKGFKTTNQEGATGDGIVMAEKAGAALVDMAEIQTHPTVEPSTATMYTEAVRGNGAILVNKEGKRFINELETRDVVSEAILNQKDKEAYLVFDQTVREGLSAIEKYISKGIVVEANSIEELASKIKVDPAALKKTIETYNGYVKAGSDAEFSRADMKVALEKPKYYAGLCAPAIHHTMGGVKVNTKAEVISSKDKIIPGLFAAGEVTGGVHGGNRLAGTAMTDIVVYGRVAAETACQYVQANGGYTDPTIKPEKEEEKAPTPEVQGNYKDGVYSGTGEGNNGPITVEVTVKDKSIVSVVLKKHTETPGIYEGAEKEVVKNIIKTQKADVDAVAGATNTSKGIMEAVKKALESAK